LQSKCEKRQGGYVAVGWGMKKKQMLRKKESSKRMMGFKTQERKLLELLSSKA